MLGAPVDGHDEARRGERLVVQLARGRAVERVRRLGPEALDVEVVGARAELLVGVEADAQRPVRKLGMRDQVRDRRHDLGDARLVVGAEQRRAVARDQIVPDVIRQLREFSTGDHLPLVAGEHDLAALVADALRLDVRAGDVGRRVDVREEPDRRHVVRDGRGHRREEIAVLVEVDVREPERQQLVAQQPQQVPLLLRRRECGRVLVGLRVDPRVPHQALRGVVRERLDRKLGHEQTLTRAAQAAEPCAS